MLKQTLRDREVRLSGMAEKLAEYESWFRETNNSHEEMLRSPTDLDAPERRRPLSYDGASPTSDVMRVEEQMPGNLLERSVHRPADVVHASQHSVPALIWATLLAVYVLA